MANSLILILINYVAWFIFVFIAVVWILVLMKNKGKVDYSEKPPRKLPEVSILIPAYNEGESIRTTIDSVLSLDYPKKLLDIIVINDCSRDSTKDIANEYAKAGKIRLISNKINRGKAFSLNRAIKICRGEYIACIDADSMVEPDILKKMIGYFREPNVAAVTPALKIWEPRNFLEKTQHAEYLLNIFLRKMLSFLDAVHVTPGVFSIYRKSVLVEVGGFDEENLTEDMEIALKIHKHGYKIENELGAVSYTLCPAKWKELYKQRLRWYRGAIQNTVKYKDILFNKRYGNLGMFYFPASFLSVFLIIGIFFVMIWNYASMVTSYLWRMSLINWDLMLLMSQVDVKEFLLSMVSTPALLSLVGISLGGYMLYISFGMSKEKFNDNRPGYFTYLLIFPFIYIIFWAMALVHEVAGAKRKW